MPSRLVRLALVLAATTLTSAAATPGARAVSEFASPSGFATTFSNGPDPVFSDLRISTSQAPGVGNFSGEYRDETLRLEVGGLAPHTLVNIRFDLYVIGSWDGTGSDSPDEFAVLAGDIEQTDEILRTNLAVPGSSQPQTFPGSTRNSTTSYPPGTGALVTNTLGLAATGDATYRMHLSAIHSAETLVVEFQGRPTPGTDERWGIDNVSITLTESLESLCLNPGAIRGTSGPDFLPGTAGPDVICAGAGDDGIDGRGGDDIIVGGPGNDTLLDGPGGDRLQGGPGNDVFGAGLGSDQMDGGPGRDRVTYATRSTGVSLTTLGGGERALGIPCEPDCENDVFASIADLRGTPQRDVLQGDGLGNVLTGLDGDDELIGDGGPDRLRGGAGDDTLSAGEGDDILEGDAGADTLFASGGLDLLLGGQGFDTLYLAGGDYGQCGADGGVVRPASLVTDRWHRSCQLG